MDDRHIVLNDEVQLLGYGESDSFGPWVKFRLLNPEDLAKFRGQEKGKKLGKRYGIALIEIGDDEQPVPQEMDEPVTIEEAEAEIESLKPSKRRRNLSQEAYLMVNTPEFKDFLIHEYGEPLERQPDAYLKYACAITSKADLDKDMAAAQRFENLRLSFRRWVNA